LERTCSRWRRCFRWGRGAPSALEAAAVAAGVRASKLFLASSMRQFSEARALAPVGSHQPQARAAPVP
jgi:hypothetical protein